MEQVVVTWKNMDGVRKILAGYQNYSYLCSAEEKKGFLIYGKIKHSNGD